MDLQIKFISEDTETITYGYKTEFDHLYFHFNKRLKTVRISYTRFIIKNYDEDWCTQAEHIKYSCRYGYWQAETPCLTMEDVEFMNNILAKMDKE